MQKELYAPTIEQILEMGNPPLCNSAEPPDPKKEVVAVATAVYEAIRPRAFDSHKMLAAQMAIDLGPNLWLIPAQEHMPYPDACLFALASMIATERRKERLADWFLWVEDDVTVPADLFRELRNVADPEKRPFVACVGYDRYPPFFPAVWDQLPSGELKRWRGQPTKGVVRVGATGLVAALFHRSLFQKVPQPWFAISARFLKDSFERMRRTEDQPISIGMGFKPDMLWSRRLNECGIPVYVHCGIDVTHLGFGMPINRRTAPILRDLRFMERKTIENMTRGLDIKGNLPDDYSTLHKKETVDGICDRSVTYGNIEQGDTDEDGKRGSVYADLRQSLPESVGSSHETDGKFSEEVLT